MAACLLLIQQVSSGKHTLGNQLSMLIGIEPEKANERVGESFLKILWVALD